MEPAAGAPAGATVGIDVLGPLRLTVAGHEVEVPGTRRRAVLALLAMAAPEPVGIDTLVDAVWPAEPPAAARQALQSHVSRIRRHLGPAAVHLSSTGAGYRFALEGDELDATRATRLVEEARSLVDREPAAALEPLRQARALWRGPALEEFADVAPLAAWARSLAELRLVASDCLVAAALAAGEESEAITVATETAAAEPLREVGVLGLMRALASGGRSVEALRAAHESRERLAEETGLEPSSALAELEHQIASGAVTSVVAPRARAAPRLVPAPTTELLGRAAELAGVLRLLESERVVTVIGPGGVGKTHLALEAARHTAHRGEVVVLGLAPVTDEAAIASALVATLGLRVATDDLLAACAERLRAGPCLLVVDNCEHLLDGARTVVATLSSTCPDLTVLATSRQRLGLPVEQTCPLTPLPLPDTDRGGVDMGTVPSVALFVDRARRVRPGFAPDDDELGLVAEIVRRMDGMPLAIELAASRLSSLGLGDLGTRLDRALDLLVGEPSRGDGRHRTLRAAVEWSYDLLLADEQRLFRSLSIFPGGFGLATAEEVAREVGCELDPASALAHLVDASMVVASLDHPPRYRMLDTLRSFGVDRLVAECEHAAAVARLLRWAAGFARWVEVTMLTEEEPLADAALRAELANLRAAWRTARASGDLDTAAALVTGLGDAAIWRDVIEVWSWARELADDPALLAHPTAAAVFAEAADAAWKGTGDLDAAERLAQRGVELVRPGDEWARQRCLAAQGDVELFRGRYDRARALHQEAGPPPGARGDALGVAALAAAYAGDLDAAAELSAAQAAAVSSPTLVGFARYVAGEIDGLTQAWSSAESNYRAALELAARSGSSFLEGIASLGLVSTLAASGQVHEALTGYRELVDYWERTGSWTQQWITLRNVADLLDRLGDGETAAFLRSAADRAPEAATVGPAAATAAAPGPAAPTTASDRGTVLEVARAAIDRQLGSALTAS